MLNRYKTNNNYGSGEVVSWASILDDNCREQAEKVSRVPVVDGYVALMPDAHFGFGPPVGSALKTRNAVMPYAVGVDIGCGMIGVRTSLTRDDFAGKEGAVLGGIRKAIPAGVGNGHEATTKRAEQFFHRFGYASSPAAAMLNAPPRGQALNEKAREQFGTLGSGNHFVEVAEDTRYGEVWFIVHSGSRGAGNLLATEHVRTAKAVCAERGIRLEDNNFAWLEAGTLEFAYYIADMLWAQNYAYYQREAMMAALCDVVAEVVGPFQVYSTINCHHNYAEEVEPGVWLTRKGAIDASDMRLGIIPGSMGAATYIVRGKGNKEAYNTAPHGAGRLIGRGAARKALDVDAFKARMGSRTWLDRDADALLDEAPDAYKPIETVIADSAELVTPTVVLSQFINFKGT